MQLKQLFKTRKTADVLISLNKEYTGNRGHKSAYKSSVARDSQMTYAHAVKVINELIQEGLIIESKEGRTSYIELTPKGKEIADTLTKLKNLIEG